MKRIETPVLVAVGGLLAVSSILVLLVNVQESSDRLSNTFVVISSGAAVLSASLAGIFTARLSSSARSEAARRVEILTDIFLTRIDQIERMVGSDLLEVRRRDGELLDEDSHLRLLIHDRFRTARSSGNVSPEKVARAEFLATELLTDRESIRRGASSPTTEDLHKWISDTDFVEQMLFGAESNSYILPSLNRDIRRAAEAGSEAAMVELGRLLTEADPPQLEEAGWWFRRAAEAGSEAAMVELGRLLTETDPPQLEQAVDWYRRAAEAGSEAAMVELGRLLTEMEQFEQAVDWYRRAAEVAGQRRPEGVKQEAGQGGNKVPRPPT